MLAPKFGTGLVISKLPDGTWSGPSAIGTFGVSWGFLAGADITDFVVFLNSNDAIAAFSGMGNVQIGAEMGVAVGPVGRGAGGHLNIGENGYAPAVAYAHSKGLYAGLGLDGSLIITRPDVNLNFYGQAHSPEDILGGEVDSPKAAGTPLRGHLQVHQRLLRQPCHHGHGRGRNQCGNLRPVRHARTLCTEAQDNLCRGKGSRRLHRRR